MSHLRFAEKVVYATFNFKVRISASNQKTGAVTYFCADVQTASFVSVPL